MQPRRTLLMLLFAVLALGVAGIVGISVLAGTPEPTKMAIDTSGMPAVTAHPIPTGFAVRALYHKPKLILLARSGDTWRAFSDRSTHLGEPVQWCAQYDRFCDEISGAMWDAAGRPVAGPAPRGLDWYPVTVHGAVVIIDLSNPKFGD